MRRRLIVVVLGLFAFAACGGSSTPEATDGPTTTARADGVSSTAPAAPTTTQDPGSTAPQPPQVGEAGSFTVDDVEFAVTLLNRCIPFSDSPGNYDLQALAQGQGAKLNLVLMGGTTEVSVDGSGIGEMFGSIAFGDDPVVESSEIDGDRWTGSATVADTLGSGTTVDITWDLMVPTEARDCSL